MRNFVFDWKKLRIKAPLDADISSIDKFITTVYNTLRLNSSHISFNHTCMHLTGYKQLAGAPPYDIIMYILIGLDTVLR